jgi:hypothetical protein
MDYYLPFLVKSNVAVICNFIMVLSPLYLRFNHEAQLSGVHTLIINPRNDLWTFRLLSGLWQDLLGGISLEISDNLHDFLLAPQAFLPWFMG